MCKKTDARKYSAHVTVTKDYGKRLLDKLEGAHIILSVKGVDGGVVHFKIKKETGLKKLMEAYCESQKLKMTDTVFLFAGKNLLETQSADELKMQDDDVIEAIGHRELETPAFFFV